MTYNLSCRAIAEQTTITTQIADILREVPKANNYEDLVNFMRESQVSYIKAVEALATSVARLEQTMSTWEQAYLPILIGQQARAPPHRAQPQISLLFWAHKTMKVTMTCKEEEEVRQPQDQDESNPHAEQQVVHNLVEDIPRPHRMQNRSLRSCCERIVHEGAPSERGHAMRPFRSNA